MKDVLAKGKSGSGLSGRDGRAGSVGNMPLWGFGRDDALKGGSEAANDLDASAGGASALGRFTPAGFKGQHQDAAPTGSQSPEEADDALQPQYRNTGKAMAQLGGEDDGKVTLLNNDLTPAEKEPARQDASETQAENGSQPLASKPDSGKDQETETPPASEQATEEEEQKQPENVNQHLKLDAAGADFIKDSEGFRAKPYEDSAGHCTIGYGHLLHLGKCTQADFDAYPDGLTKKEAVDLFNSKAEEYQSAVRRLVTVPLTQAQYNALVSLVYNVGEGEFAKSRTLKNINSGNDELAKEEWLGFEYETKNGKKVKNKGLRERREREIKIFFGGE
jgi:GH24 family phage-related lysozyme (muramidase)